MIIIGHKGCSIHPNTGKSVKYVLKHYPGIYAIEVDVRNCQDCRYIFRIHSHSNEMK